MRLAGYKPARREGAREGRWTLLDYVDIVVHIQHQDERNFYALDRLVARLPDHSRRPGGAGACAMRVRRLVMLRHGQTEFNAGSRMQGQLDTDLSDLGRDQAVGRRRGAGQAAAAGRSSPRTCGARLDTAVTHSASGPVCRCEVDTRLRETHLGRLAGPDASRGGCGVRRERAWRGATTPRWAPHGGESRVDVAARGMPVVAELVADQTEWGTDEPERPVVLVAHGGLIAALTAALLKLPVDNWPALGGMGNASWVQLSGHSDRRRGIRRYPVAARCMERLGTGRQRCPLNVAPCSSSATRSRTTGRRADFPSDDPRIWPNIVAVHLGWDVELIGRIGWTCRDVWWAATQDPRSWAALPRAGAVIFATCGMDSLPSPLPTALRELIRYVRPSWLRRWVRDGYGWVQPRLSPVARAALPPHVSVEYLGADPRRNRFQPARHPHRGLAAVGAHRRDLR